jgi:hypothetical protein
MARLKEGSRFAHQVAIGSERFGPDTQVLGSIGGDVEIVLWRDIRGERKFLEILARKQWRIDELFERDRLKLNFL